MLACPDTPPQTGALLAKFILRVHILNPLDRHTTLCGVAPGQSVVSDVSRAPMAELERMARLRLAFSTSEARGGAFIPVGCENHSQWESIPDAQSQRCSWTGSPRVHLCLAFLWLHCSLTQRCSAEESPQPADPWEPPVDLAGSPWPLLPPRHLHLQQGSLCTVLGFPSYPVERSCG